MLTSKFPFVNLLNYTLVVVYWIYILEFIILLEDAVFTVSVDKKSSNLVVTGGQDDRGFVWSANTGEQIMECNGM